MRDICGAYAGHIRGIVLFTILFRRHRSAIIVPMLTLLPGRRVPMAASKDASFLGTTSKQSLVVEDH
jgi:hypothetical protein